jgi:hypothetical protein
MLGLLAPHLSENIALSISIFHPCERRCQLRLHYGSQPDLTKLILKASLSVWQSGKPLRFEGSYRLGRFAAMASATLIYCVAPLYLEKKQ